MSRNRRTWKTEVPFVNMQEDKALSQLVVKIGENWSKISEQMDVKYHHQRTSKQCYQRWKNVLELRGRPQVQWNEEEEIQLLNYHQQFGNNWKKIANVLNKRKGDQVKNHFFSTVRKKLRSLCKLVGESKKSGLINHFKPNTICHISSNPKFSNIFAFLLNCSQTDFMLEKTLLRSQMQSLFQENLGYEKEVEEKKRLEKNQFDTIGKRVAEHYQNTTSLNTSPQSRDEQFKFTEFLDDLPPLKEEKIEFNPFALTPIQLGFDNFSTPIRNEQFGFKSSQFFLKESSFFSSPGFLKNTPYDPKKSMNFDQCFKCILNNQETFDQEVIFLKKKIENNQISKTISIENEFF